MAGVDLFGFRFNCHRLSFLLSGALRSKIHKEIGGVHLKNAELPPFIYGTAWKEDVTAELTKKALTTGFRGIDTANQRRHYCEALVGEALVELKRQGICRESLFLQSKYTYPQGQDQRLPYDPHADFGTQVRSSFASSLEHLHTDYLDSYLLHGPMYLNGMTDSDWEVWAAMEDLEQSGQVRMIGVSNVSLHHLTELCKQVKIKPSIVQNRCYAVRGWDRDVREYCLKHQIVYQGFSLLTANPHVLADLRVVAIARRLKVTREQVIFRFAAHIGILPLTGTSNPRHMKEDLEITNFELSRTDLNMIHAIA